MCAYEHSIQFFDSCHRRHFTFMLNEYVLSETMDATICFLFGGNLMATVAGDMTCAYVCVGLITFKHFDCSIIVKLKANS